LETLTASFPNELGATTESGAVTAASVGLVNCGIAISSRTARMTRMATVSKIENPKRAARLTNSLLGSGHSPVQPKMHGECRNVAYYKTELLGELMQCHPEQSEDDELG
jgi:hypothetical protein